MHRRIAAYAIASLVILSADLAAAQSLPPLVRVASGGDGALVRLSISSARKSKATLRVGKGKSKTIHKGACGGTLIAGHGKVIAALTVDHGKKPFRVWTIDDDKPGKATLVKRPGNRNEDYPFVVVGTATPDGFTVFFQEIQTDDPSAAHTYMLALDKDGKPDGDAKEIAVPWALADAIWNGGGYHLALIYSGDQRGMRLSMVSLSEQGQPQQHPDWASAGGFISDVHLVRDDETIYAYYRGGTSGDRLERGDVTKIGNWGSEPPKAKDLGKIGAGKVIAITGKGKAKKVASR